MSNTNAAPYGGAPVAAQVPPGGKVKRPVKVWDLVLSIVFAIPMLLLVFGTMFMSPFLFMASDPCGVRECNYDLMSAGIAVCFFGPIVIFVIALALMIVLLVLRRVAFYVPLIGIALIVGVFVLGMSMVASGVPGASL